MSHWVLCFKCTSRLFLVTWLGLTFKQLCSVPSIPCTYQGRRMTDLVKMKIFVPQGVTCFSGTTFDLYLSVRELAGCVDGRRPTSLSWQKSRHMIFHRVHKAIEEVSPIFDPATSISFLLTLMNRNAHEQLFFAVFTSRFEFFGGMSLDPCHPGVGHIGLVWRRERVGYLPQQPAAPTSQGFGFIRGDFFACYERCDSCRPFHLAAIAR